MATQFKISQPYEYYKKFLKQDVRPDGRELGEIRSTVLSIGSIKTADGSALVKLGNTTIVCGIKCELATPKSENPKDGFLIPNVELPPLCSPKFKPGPPSDQAQTSSVFLDNYIKQSKCFDLESLCVEEGKFVWVLFCDLVCLDYDGNINDACTLALLAALKDVRLPRVSFNDETGLVEVNREKKDSLQFLQQPVATSFAIFDDEVLVVDPTSEEEELSRGSITVVTHEDGRLCLLEKPGGIGISDGKLQDCVVRARARSKEVCSLIETTVQAPDR